MFRKTLLLTAALLLVLPAWAERPFDRPDFGSFMQRAQGAPTHTVYVDCAEGQSVGKALQHPARYLTVEIRGVCEENVAIWRNNVTLRGTDPNLDVLRGVATDPAPYATVELWYADTIRIENLTLRDGAGYGLGAWFSSLVLDNVRIVDNGDFGLHATASSWVVASNTSFLANFGGARVQRNAGLICDNCVFEGNQDWALRSRRADVQLVGGRVEGPYGLSSNDGGQVVAYYTPIDTENFGASATDSGTVALIDLEIAGSMRTFNNGSIRLFGVTQTFNPIGNMVADHGNFEAWDSFETPTDTTTLLGPLNVMRFGQVFLKQGTALNGDMSCAEAGDAYADSPGLITGTVTGCEHCP